MYRKIMWCYFIILTLLDISLNSQLTAQGKSHGTGYSVHDTLAEGVNFQEWGKESGGAGVGAGAGTVAGGAPALRLSPPALALGPRPLGVAHAVTVTLVNTANATLHLASVAGTTPDFHASFFDTKTLAPNGNTTFNVVYLGRREGLVSALLFIHTSHGVYKYPVSALGVASQWEVWPWLGLRVPANASLEPTLSVRNPTSRPVQVTEVYSSGSWVKLVVDQPLSAEAWLLPPHRTRPLLRLRLEPPAPPHAHTHTAYVRIKTNASDSGLIVAIEARAAPAGEYTAPVQLRLRARGHRDPPDTWEISLGSSAGGGGRLEAGVTGARCEPYGHSAARAVPPPPPPAHPPHPPAQGDAAPHEEDHAHHNGVKSLGASVSVLRPAIEPYQPLAPAATLTLHYEKLWAEFSGEGPEGAGAGEGEGAPPHAEGAVEAEGAFCTGTLSLGRAAVPYSLRLLRGTLALTPPNIDLITSDLEGGTKVTELVAENEFLIPIHLEHLEYSDDVEQFAHVAGFGSQVIAPGAKAVVARLQLKDDVGLTATLDSKLVLHTNISMYSVPLRVYSGKLELEWEWPTAEEGHLSLGALGVSSTRRVAVRLRNPAPAPLCVRALRTDLPGAQLALPACAAPPAPPARCRCIEPGEAARAVLTLVAPARAGALRGAVAVSTAHATAEATVSLTAHDGRLAALPVHLDICAPYAWAVAPVIIDNSMSLRMRVLGWSDAGGAEGGGSGAGGGAGGGPDLALTYRAPPNAEIAPGRSEVGHVTYMPERLCEPYCYTGLDTNTEEGMAWVANGAAWLEPPPGGAGGADGAEGAERWRAGRGRGARVEAALAADRALLAARVALYRPRAANISLHVRTTQVVLVSVTGSVQLGWPRLLAGGGGGAGGADAGLAGVGSAARLRLRARNPSPSHTLLLQPVLGPPPPPLPPAASPPPPDALLPDLWRGAESPACAGGAGGAGGAAGGGGEACVYAADAFRLVEWRARSGDAREWHPPPPARGRAGTGAGGAGSGGNSSVGLPMLALGPKAEVELHVSFVPREPRLATAYLYLRNNLTILEGVQLSGRGAFPSFEIGGRRPGAAAPLVFEVTECGATAAGGAGAGTAVGAGGAVRRVVAARNTGAVGVRLREWRVSGGACGARGFALAPCAPLALQPNQSAPLVLSYTPDFTLARVRATLELRTDTRARAAFQLAAVTAPRLLAACARQAPRPPFDASLRATGTLLVVSFLVLVLATAALDSERLLRRARHARHGPQPHVHAPLDLRAVAAAPAPPPPPAPAPPPPRAPPPRRRKVRKMDPAAESRAFERWRASLRRPDDTDSRSSEDMEPEPPPAERVSPPPAPSPSPPPPPPAPAPTRAHTPPPAAPAPAPYEPLLQSEGRRGRPPSSGDDEPQSSESECSSPLELELEPDDERAHTPPPEPRPPPRADRDRLDRVDRADRTAAAAPADTHTHTQTRARRREAESRRTERREGAAGAGAGAAAAAAGGTRGGSGSVRAPARRDKPRARRERERAAPTPPRTSPRSSPPATGTEPRGGSASSNGGGGAGAGAGAGATAVRWGASWSSVVARSSATPPAPPAPAPAPSVPITPAVTATPPPAAAPAPEPTPAPAPLPAHAPLTAHAPHAPHAPHALRPADSNSLFYFNGDAMGGGGSVGAGGGGGGGGGGPATGRDTEYSWPPPPPPARPDPHYATSRDFREEPADRGGSYGSIGGAGLWGGVGGVGGVGAERAWPWSGSPARSYCPAPGAGPVRPPPGFGSPPGSGSLPPGPVGSMPPGPPGPPGPVGSRVRPFDPFQSLAAIWSRTALDWRDTDEHHEN